MVSQFVSWTPSFTSCISSTSPDPGFAPYQPNTKPWGCSLQFGAVNCPNLYPGHHPSPPAYPQHHQTPVYQQLPPPGNQPPPPPVYQPQPPPPPPAYQPPPPAPPGYHL